MKPVFKTLFSALIIFALYQGIMFLCPKESAVSAKEAGFSTIKEKINIDKPDFSKLKTTGGRPTDQNPEGLSNRQRKAAQKKAQSMAPAGGYYGTLPNIEREFEYIKQTSKKTKLENKYTDGFLDENNLQKTPLDDDLFLDVILKKEKDSDYIKAVLKIAPILEKFKTCIEENCNLQKFNANVNLVDLYARRLQDDFGTTEDANQKSFYLIQNISYLAKLQGNLKYEANFYSKYMPLSGTIYSKENIQEKDYELFLELEKTIFELQQLK